MIYVLTYVLILFLIAFISFGSALLVIESPYFKPIVTWVENRYGDTTLGALFVKGMRCYSCSSFWFSILIPIFIQLVSNVNLFPERPIAFIFCCLMTGLLGSGFATTGAYLIQLYFDMLDKRINKEYH